MRTILVCGMIALLASVAGAAPTPARPLPWLHTAGTHVVDTAGKPVVLGGVNLGGWLVQEMWMMPFQTVPPAGSEYKEIKDQVGLWRTLDRRLGAADTARVRTALRSAWITERDFDRIQAAGLNCIRLPFLYDLLDEPGGVLWLDRALDWARVRGIYVILDLHGTPGRQSRDHTTGEADVDRLFKDPAMVAQTEAVWTRIARRYRDRPEVAAYDIINEPTGAPNPATLHLVQDRLYRAIRAVDARHILIVEDGYKGMDSLPYPALIDWKNVVLSTHHYRFDAKSEAEQTSGVASVAGEAKKLAAARGVPFFIGEFQLEPQGNATTMAGAVRAFTENGLSWAAWTYKVVMNGGGGGMWGWHRARHSVEPLNPFQDTTAELLRKIAQVRTENLEEDAGLTAAYGAAGH